MSLLNPDEKYSQFRQDESFKEGLKKACDYFRDAFTITARGMSRAHWAEDPENHPIQPPSDLDVLVHKSDLLDSASKLQGSRDVGAQLFCALLRSAGVETRLVCSLQALPLVATAKGITPQKLPIKPIPIIDYNPPTSDNDSDQHVSTSQTSPPSLSKGPIGAQGGRTRFSNPDAPPATSNPYPRPFPQSKPKRFRESPHPIYWLEVFNPYSNKYTSLDPLVTHTIGKPSALTPALSDPLNSLNYAIGFNDDLTAKDVTRRYTRAYNAKILKQRIDLSPPGKAWLLSVLALFIHRGRRIGPKDEQEDTELAKKEASEPMPRNIQDFKNHPVYALERHLHRAEIIHPRHEIGRVNTGTGSKSEGKSEPVFRRKDVLSCRTADQWFRVGKEIKAGEQPLKRLLPAASSLNRTQRSPAPNEDDNDGEAGIKNLYALHQTKLYVPLPIPPSGAPIPRNVFRNLDVYVPSMVPARGWHSLHPLTSSAAKILGIDHVPAVTGFSFSTGGGTGRSRGSATVTGAIVWEGHREAVEAAIEGLEILAEKDETERWRAVLWSTWKNMIRGLRVRQRVKGYQIEGEGANGLEEQSTQEENEEMEMSDEEMEVDDEEMEENEGGGFFPEQGGEEAMPTAGPRRTGGRKLLLDSESEDEDMYVPSEEEEDFRKNEKEAIRTLIDPTIRGAGKRREELTMDESEAGGLLPEDADEAGGGFITEEAEDSAGVLTSHEDSGGELSRDEARANLPRDNGEKQATLRSSLPPQSSNPTGHETHRVAQSLPEPVSDHTVAWDETPNSPRKDISEMVAPHFGNLTEEELIEARLLEEYYAEGNHSDKMQGVKGGGGGGGGGGGEEEDKVGHRELPSSTERQVEEGIEENGEREEDQGSLLSEDPSDAEAEPEWLT